MWDKWWSTAGATLGYRLGDGTKTNRDSPVRVIIGDNNVSARIADDEAASAITAMAPGDEHSCIYMDNHGASRGQLPREGGGIDGAVEPTRLERAGRSAPERGYVS